MIRIGLITYLALVTAAGNALCCCAPPGRADAARSAGWPQVSGAPDDAPDCCPCHRSAGGRSHGVPGKCPPHCPCPCSGGRVAALPESGSLSVELSALGAVLPADALPPAEAVSLAAAAPV